MDTSACAWGEGDDGIDWSRDDGIGDGEAFVRRCVGGVGGIAHLEGEAIVAVHEEVRPGESDVVVELCEILVDMVAVWPEERLALEVESRQRGDIPENMSSLNSWHPFSNFSTGSQVRDHTSPIYNIAG